MSTRGTSWREHCKCTPPNERVAPHAREQPALQSEDDAPPNNPRPASRFAAVFGRQAHGPGPPPQSAATTERGSDDGARTQNDGGNTLRRELEPRCQRARACIAVAVRRRGAQLEIVGVGAVGASMSGLDFQRARQSVSANNLANIATEDFKPTQAIAVAKPDGGVGTQIIELQGPPTVAHEVLSQKAAIAAYRANVAVLKTSDEITQSMLDALLR